MRASFDMKHFYFTLILSWATFSLGWAQAPLLSLSQLQAKLSAPSDQIKVVNFWATWCAPCVKELPLFEALYQNRKDVDVMLVSMDLDLDPNPEKVNKFIDRKGITAPVLILNERNPNEWIDKIDPRWSGALPATLIVNSQTGERLFLERQVCEGELEILIDKMKQQN